LLYAGNTIPVHPFTWYGTRQGMEVIIQE